MTGFVPINAPVLFYQQNEASNYYLQFRELSNVNCEAPIFTCSIDTGATNDVIGARVRL